MGCLVFFWVFEGCAMNIEWRVFMQRTFLVPSLVSTCIRNMTILWLVRMYLPIPWTSLLHQFGRLITS